MVTRLLSKLIDINLIGKLGLATGQNKRLYSSRNLVEMDTQLPVLLLG